MTFLTLPWAELCVGVPLAGAAVVVRGGALRVAASRAPWRRRADSQIDDMSDVPGNRA